MTSPNAIFDLHIFVCCNERSGENARPSCGRAHGDAIRAQFQAELEARGLTGRMRANKSLCLDACEAGPAVVIYPEGVWYRVTDKEAVRRIIDEHVVGGNIVTDLLLDTSLLPTD